MSRALQEGQSAFAAGRLVAAETHLRAAVEATPDQPAALLALAECLLIARRPRESLTVCERALSRLPDQADLHCAKARALQALGHAAEARGCFEAAIQLQPGHAPARFGLALQALEEGRAGEARSWLKPLFESRDPTPDVQWLAARLALADGRAAEAAALAGGVAQRAELRPDQRAEALLLAGEALDRLGRFDEAFADFAAAKRLLRRYFAERAAGREGELARLERLLAWFAAADPGPWRRAPGARSAGGATTHVFLLGFPRSGTTLIEQALAGHSRVATLEEAPLLARAADRFLSNADAVSDLSRLGEEEAEFWRADYWRTAAAAGAKLPADAFVDKAPAASALAPLIAKLFPDARVIFAIRDPRDVVWSCFRNNFQMNALTYAFTDLVEAAQCYAATMALARLYRNLLSLPWFDLRYEDLVHDFAGGLERMCRFLGIEFEAPMADVAATAARRPIRTPSAAQVRAGLNRQGLGRWRAYAGAFGEAAPILAPWVERLGYAAAGSAAAEP
ncbi:MAG TPA: sulfotransferase [Caulobacteraceae bacterium]|nr:sulfotransferase [Caulobacteraceae bacterium]